MAYKVGDRVVTDGGGYHEEDGDTPIEHGRPGVVTGIVYGGDGKVSLYDVILDNLPAAGAGVAGGLAFYPTEIVGLEGEV